MEVEKCNKYKCTITSDVPLVLKNYHKSGSLNMKWAKIQSWIAMKLDVPTENCAENSPQISCWFNFENFDFIVLQSRGKTVVLYRFSRPESQAPIPTINLTKNVSRNVMVVCMFFSLFAFLCCFLISWFIP